MAEKYYSLDKRENLGKLSKVISVVCLVLLLVEPLVHLHPTFAIEHTFGFYGVFGFLSCMVLVFATKVLRELLMRDEGLCSDE